MQQDPTGVKLLSAHSSLSQYSEKN